LLQAFYNRLIFLVAEFISITPQICHIDVDRITIFYIVAGNTNGIDIIGSIVSRVEKEILRYLVFRRNTIVRS
ncbi:MAG: hypothetical protein PVF13_04680, partial [Chromatiales bacterium]